MQDRPPHVPDQETAPAPAGDALAQPSAQIQTSAELHQPEPAPGLEEQLLRAEQKVQEHHDAWLRAKAEVENVRRRAQIDVANAHRYAIEEMVTELLLVKDSLEAALASENATFDALRSGVELTLKQLAAVFEKSSVSEVNPQAERFDPHRHHAISMLPSEKEPNTVVKVLQKGYLLHDRVIRPALVIVAKPEDA